MPDPRDLQLSSYDYPLPPECIAQAPVEPRHSARLLMVPPQREPSAEAAHGQVWDLLEQLQPGDLLGDQSGSTVVEVTAAPEALMRVQGSHPLELLQAAYHLGNRHVALELHEQELLLPEDSVLATMLEGRGLTVSSCLQPFAPEGGAYGGHQHG